MRSIVLVMLVLVGACTKDVHAVYPSEAGATTGTVVLLLSSAASGVSVAIEGLLVVEDAHTDRIVITGVPIGTDEIVMSANGADKAMRVWVGMDHATTIPLGVPDATPGFLKSIAGTLISLVVYSLIH